MAHPLPSRLPVRDRPPGRRGVHRLAALLLVCGLGTACGAGNGEGSRALYELERLAFVPAGDAKILGFAEKNADCSLERAIVIDLFEFTREDGLYYDFDRWSEDVVGASEAATPGEAKLRWPLFLNYYEATALAEKRGMRLPLAREWIHVATLGGVQKYPWHRFLPMRGVLNIQELGLERPSPVGAFERGRASRFGCYDMMGNVWEWVSDVVPGYEDSYFGEQEMDPATGRPIEASILGGAYDTEQRTLFGEHLRPYSEPPRLRFFARRQPCATRVPDIGARMCADAEAYLWAKASAWGSGSEAHRRIRAIGRRWAESVGYEVVSTFLDDLAEREGAPTALAWLAEGAHR